MMKYKFITLILAMSLLAGVALAGQPIERGKASLQKTSVNDVFAPMDINNIFSYYKNNGDGSLNPYTGDGGFEIISANRGITVFEEGLVFGGYQNGKLKVGGSTYNQGWQAGPIITPAVVVGGVQQSAPVAADPNDPKYRLYRVRPDVRPDTTKTDGSFVPFADVEAVLNQEIALYAKYDGTTTAQSLYDAYVADWKEWPADEGAPYKDVNGNGKYDWQVDIPGVPGADQTMWYVVNDLDVSRAHHLYGSDPIGIEMQKTIWAYRLSGALGNTIFQKNKIINKSGFPIDTMYVGQWADCDNGGGLGYKDDFTGCDSVLGLGFTYNGTNNDGFFGPKPPAIGFDFFQGPIIPTDNPADRAIFNGGYRYGYKNLNMTGFNFFINSNNLYRDPTLDSPKGTPEMYNLLKGLIVTTGAPNIDPTTNQPTKFALAGDPVAGTGWIDGTIAGPDDRRMILTSGPFTMAAGDTQEVVVGELAAQAYDRLSSVSLLKYFDRQAQSAYDQFFDLPKPPAQPAVTVTPLDKEIILDWSKSAAAVENPAPKGYAFQGYNVYQLPGAGFTNQKLLATYDLKDAYGTIVDTIYSAQLGALVYIPVQNGNNQGIARYFDAKMDYINNKPFVDGQTYYFAVTAYNLNTAPGASPVSLESAPIVLAVTPHTAAPGVRYGLGASDTVAVQHTAGVSDGIVTPIVLDPLKLTGNTYKVTFDTLGGATVWSLTNTTTGQVLLSNQTNLSGDNMYTTVDGIFLKVQAPPPGMKNYAIPAGARQWTWSNANFGMEGFNGAMGNAFDNWFSSSTVTYDKLKNVLIKLAKTDTSGIADPNDPNTSYGYRYVRGATANPAKPEFAPFIVNPTAGYAFQDFKNNMPFTAWDVESNPPRQLAVGYLENNAAGGLVDGKYWPGLTDDNVGAAGSREWFFIFDVNYSTTQDPALAVDILNNTVPMMWFGTPDRRNAGAWAAGNQFLIEANHVATKADVYTFTPPPATQTVENGKIDVQKINVFPNPYFGFNSKEPNKYNRFVTFNHLPKNATLNIINLAGVRVKTIIKNDDTQFINWDLTNTSGLPVAAGMYIVYIDMGQLGTKVVKLAIIPEAQQLDRY